MQTSSLRSGIIKTLVAGALGLLAAGNLRADLAGRLGVVASSLASSGAAAGHPLALVCSGSAGGDPADPLGRSLADGLRQALADTAVSLLPATATAGDWVLAVAYQPEAAGVAMRAELHGEAGASALWTRRIEIPAEDLPPGTLAGQAAQAPDTGFDTIPQPPADGRARKPFHWNLSAAYKAFLPLNSTFQSVAGRRLDGLSLGASFTDVVLVDIDAWHADLSGQGTLQSLDYGGLALAVVAPLHLGPVTLYAGPGGRFGSITLNDSSIPDGAVSFGNNGAEAVAGVKAQAGRYGLDLRYAYDFASTYTGYHTLRLGAYYDFGR
jgi:hypothetical protein